MKLFFDENLSSRLVYALDGIYPGSEHVAYCKLDAANDSQIWDYAKARGSTIVSKDSDFYDRSVVLGSPPKVIWLKVGNCSTNAIEDLPRNAEREIRGFIEEDAETCLILSLRSRELF